MWAELVAVATATWEKDLGNEAATWELKVGIGDTFGMFQKQKGEIEAF